jgi:hypothetical protein
MAQQKLTRTDKIVLIQANGYMSGINLFRIEEKELDRLVSIINSSKNPLSWKAEDWQFINLLKDKPSGKAQGEFSGGSSKKTVTNARHGKFTN